MQWIFSLCIYACTNNCPLHLTQMEMMCEREPRFSDFGLKTVNVGSNDCTVSCLFLLIGLASQTILDNIKD